MRTALILILALVTAQPLRAAPDIAPGVEKFLQSYCVKCHGAEKQKGELRFDTLPRTMGDAAVAQKWQDILDTLNLSEMPPEDEKQPPKQELADALESLTGSLLKARRRLVDSGGDIVVRHLNRREYQQTIQSLFGVPVEASFLPDDEKIDGFDTLGQAQSFSSLHLERYLDLGRRVLDRVIVTPKKKSGEMTKKKSEFGTTDTAFEKEVKKLDKEIVTWSTTSKGNKKENALRLLISESERKLVDEYRAHPAAATGALIPFRGIKPNVEFSFGDQPAIGNYRVRVVCGAASGDKAAEDLYLKVVRGSFRSKVPDAVDYYHVTGTVAAPQTIEFTVELDAKIRANRLSFERRNGKLAKVPALAESREYYHSFPDVVRLLEDKRMDLWIDSVEVEGPLPGAVPPLGMASLFEGRDPAKLADADARSIVERFVFQAFRRQTPEPEYVDKLMKVFSAGRAHGATFPAALKDTLAIVLASPRFLYLFEPRAAGQPPRPLTDRELAIRLSYFLWSAPPDDELWRVAESGKLREPSTLSGQITRMIASERSTLFVETFLTGWLDLERLDGIKPEATHAPAYDDAVQRSTRRETIAFFQTLLRENRPVHALIHSDFVTVDSIAARFYGLPGVTGDAFRKVKLPAGSVRGGLLGQSAILTLTGTGDRTSPVERGAYVLRKILDRPPPPAPANVPMLDEKEVGTRSIRETLNLHMDKAQCSSCHQRIDPLGFALENFDPVGLWREKVPSTDGSKTFPIATAGAMPDGMRTFADFPQLKQRIMEDRDAMLRGLIKAMMTYALGRTVGFADQESVEQTAAATARDGYGLGTLLYRIIHSKAFTSK